MEVDVVVVGSGVGGLTTAVVAAQHGLSVLVLESTPLFGGTAAYSGGGAWIPFNHHMLSMGYQDSREEALEYLRSVLGDFYDERKVAAFLDNAEPMLSYMENNTEVEMIGTRMPDYETERKGWKQGRLVVTKEYDSRLLGSDRKKLRPPRPDTMLFHSMQLSMFDPTHMMKAHKSLRSFVYTSRIFLRYWFERLAYGRGVRVTRGNALVAQLLASAKKSRVELWDSSPAVSLLKGDGGTVIGLIAERKGQREVIRAKRGVVLAGGGFGANDTMRAEFIPHAKDAWNFQPEGCRGESISMGVAAGGSINRGNIANGVWGSVSGHPRIDGSMALSVHAYGDHYAPGSLIVDAATGKRFVNEGCSYQSFGQAMHTQNIQRCWMISEAPAARKYGMGLAKPWPFPIRPWIKKGYIKAADSIPQLAVKIGIDPEALVATVERFNRNAELGIDPDFGKGQDVYSHFCGDQSHKPNPALGPVKSKPFYAVEIRVGALTTLAGLDTNANAQVLASDGRPIGGLYAVGLDGNNIWRGHYPGGGAGIGPTMTFGYSVARQLASARDLESSSDKQRLSPKHRVTGEIG